MNSRKPKLSQEEVIEKLGSLKGVFQGTRFQWIRPPKPELQGKIVKCIDIEYLGGDVFMAQFEDGSKIQTKHLNTNLMMLGEGVEPMDPSAIAGINEAPHLNERMDGSEVAQDIKKKVGEEAAQEFVQERESNLANVPASELAAGGNGPKAKKPVAKATPPKRQVADMFSAFSTEPRSVTFDMKVNLPTDDLLKMMYENAKNKEEFLNNLAEYVISEINNDTIKGAVEGWFGVTPVEKDPEEDDQEES